VAANGEVPAVVEDGVEYDWSKLDRHQKVTTMIKNIMGPTVQSALSGRTHNLVRTASNT
jgi:hypothetical protein